MDVAEHLFLTDASIKDGLLAATSSDILNPLVWWKRMDCFVPTGVSSGWGGGSLMTVTQCI